MTEITIAANVKNSGLADEDVPECYLLRTHRLDSTFMQDLMPNDRRRVGILLRSPLDPSKLLGWLRREIASLDAALPVQIETMKQRVGKLGERPRFNTVLLGSFAGIGLFLAAIGLYGVMAI